MLLGGVTGSAMFYMRYIVNSTPIYEAPRISGGMMGGGFTTDQSTSNVFTVNIVICILVFVIGLAIFCFSGRRKHA
jgi:hypothetical protein